MSMKQKATWRGSEVVRAIRSRGMTLAGWSRVHGFSLPSVARVVHGTYGGLGPVGERIFLALREEGFLKKAARKDALRKSA